MRRSSVLALVLFPAFAACASGGPPAPLIATTASGAEWATLFRPRIAPLADAPRIAVGSISTGEERWQLGTRASSPALVVQELVGAGLLRRADVQFVERRRFAEAAERERRGLTRPPGAPEVGTSPGVEMLLTGTMTPLLGDSVWLDVRLVQPATGEFRAAWRVGVPRGADPTGISRRIIGSLLAALESLQALPEWSDPRTDATASTWRGTDVSVAAVEAFARGVAAEDAYDWEAARRGYQLARQLGGEGFFEPDIALARVARLRAGGTLGAS